MYKVFYNPDCAMYGVQKFIKDNGSGRKNYWTQVLPPKNKGARKGKSAYTHYKAIAEKWILELERSK